MPTRAGLRALVITARDLEAAAHWLECRGRLAARTRHTVLAQLAPEQQVELRLHQEKHPPAAG